MKEGYSAAGTPNFSSPSCDICCGSFERNQKPSPQKLNGERITKYLQNTVDTAQMLSGSVYSETLQSITTTKLEQLSKNREEYEQRYEEILKSYSAENDTLKRLHALSEGVKSIFNVQVDRQEEDSQHSRVRAGGTNKPDLEVALANIDRFIEQAKYDPSVSSNITHEWEQTLLRHLKVQSTKYQVQ
jgi:hypothetical protein